MRETETINCMHAPNAIAGRFVLPEQQNNKSL